MGIENPEDETNKKKATTMTNTFTLLTLLSLLSLTGKSSASPLIDDGIKAKDGQFPSVVRISSYLKLYGLEFLNSLCTGTLITPTVVLTAAHCIPNSADTIQRVSLAGDASSKTDRRLYGLMAGGGIKVKKSYKVSFYDRYYNLLEKSYEKISDEKFDSLPEELQMRHKNEHAKYLALTLRNDIGILILNGRQSISVNDLSSLGCKEKLTSGSRSMIVGNGIVRQHN
jgi:hypothetical protein